MSQSLRLGAGSPAQVFPFPAGFAITSGAESLNWSVSATGSWIHIDPIDLCKFMQRAAGAAALTGKYECEGVSCNKTEEADVRRHTR